MSDLNPQQIGKIITAIGLMITILGISIIVLGKLGLFKLPGDLEFGSKNVRFYFPLTSCIIISLILTFILWMIRIFGK